MKTLKQYVSHSVLIIDDSEPFVKFALMHLKQSGLKKVYSALSGIEGINLAKKYNPDIVLLDIEMPGISGFDVLDQFHKYHLNLKVILITAHDTGHVGMRGARLGITDFVSKGEFFQIIDIKIMEALDFGQTIFEKNQSPLNIINTNFDILEKIFLGFDSEQQSELLKKLNQIRDEMKINPPNKNKILTIIDYIKYHAPESIAAAGIIEIVKGLLHLIK